MTHFAPALVLLTLVGTTNALKVGVGDKQWPFMPPAMPMMPAALPQWGMPAAAPQWGMPAAPPQWGMPAAPQKAAAPQFGMPAQSEMPKTTSCPEQSDDSCECLSWEDAFSTHNASCDWAQSLCHELVKKLPDDKFCIGEGNPYVKGQWCYVSSKCASGRRTLWGMPVGDSNGCEISAQWKTCGEGEQRLLGDTKFEDLVTWTKTHDLDLGQLMPMAYDILDEQKLPDVLTFWGIDQPNMSAVHPISLKLRNKLQKVVNSGRTTLIDSPDGLPPFGVVEGRKLYFVNYADDVATAIYKGEQMKASPSHRNEATCVVGCENVSPARWTVLNECYPSKCT